MLCAEGYVRASTDRKHKIRGELDSLLLLYLRMTFETQILGFVAKGRQKTANELSMTS
jgi:hypothetical protein